MFLLISDISDIDAVALDRLLILRGESLTHCHLPVTFSNDICAITVCSADMSLTFC